jgi:hypothetical protein
MAPGAHDIGRSAMPILRSESHGTEAAPPAQQFHEVHDDEQPAHDDTTLKFEGRMSVTDEDAGADPYNRTGRFRRLVR